MVRRVGTAWVALLPRGEQQTARRGTLQRRSEGIDQRATRVARSIGARARGLHRALETIHFIAPRVCAEPGKCRDSRPGWWNEGRGLGRRSVRGGCRGDIRTGGESEGRALAVEDKIRDGVPKIGSGTAIAPAHRGSTTPSRTRRSSVDGTGRATESIALSSGWRREAQDHDADRPVGPSNRSLSGMIVRID